MSDLLANIAHLSHSESLIVQYSAAKRVKGYLAQDASHLATVLEALSGTNLNVIDGMIRQLQLDPFSAVCALLPSAPPAQVGPLFSLVFATPHHLASEAPIHPFIVMLNLRADACDEWLARFPLDKVLLLENIETGGHYVYGKTFRRLLPCFYLPKSTFGTTSALLLEKLVLTIVNKFNLKKSQNVEHDEMRRTEREAKYAFTPYGYSSDEEFDEDGLDRDEWLASDPFEKQLDSIIGAVTYWHDEIGDSTVFACTKIMRQFACYMNSESSGPRYEFIITFINRFGLVSDTLIDLHYHYDPIDGVNGWECAEFKHELILTVATLAIKDMRYLKYLTMDSRDHGSNHRFKPSKYVTPYIVATFLSHLAYAEMAGFGRKYLMDALTVMCDDDTRSCGYISGSTDRPDYAKLNNVWTRKEALLISNDDEKWTSTTINMLFGIICGPEVHYDGDIDINPIDKERAFQAISLLKTKIASGSLAEHHVDIYTKIQIGLTTKIYDESYDSCKSTSFIINTRYRHEIIGVLNQLTMANSLALNASSTLTTFMGTSAALSPVTATMVYQQLKTNPVLFSKFYEKVTHVLNNSKATYCELYITAVSLREAVKLVTNYAELVTSALKLYTKTSKTPETAPIAALAIESLHVLIEHGELNIFSFWSYFMSQWTNNTAETRNQVLNAFIACLSCLPQFEPTNQESLEYQQFTMKRDEIIVWLFSMINGKGTRKAAFNALSTYPMHYFTVKTIPAHLHDYVTTTDQEEIINFFPLITESEENLDDLIVFMRNLLVRQVTALPRDIAHRAMKKMRLPWRNKEETGRLSKIKQHLGEAQARHKSNPEMRSKVTLASLSTDTEFTSTMDAICKLRQFVTDCPFDTATHESIEYMINAWKKFMTALFDYTFHEEKCTETVGDEKLMKLIRQIFNELNQASTKSPSSQMNALVGLGVLLNELVFHQQMYGDCNAVSEFLASAIDIFVNLTFDRTNYTLSWSHYSSDEESGGKYAMSQLAKQVIYLIWAKFLVNLVKLGNNEEIISDLKRLISAKTAELDDFSRVGAYGLGALSQKLDMFQLIEPGTQNQTLYVAGMINQSDPILHRSLLERIKASSLTNLVTHKLNGVREVTLPSGDIDTLGYVLRNKKFTETEKRNAFDQLFQDAAESDDVDALGQLAQYQVVAGSNTVDSVLPRKYDYLAAESMLRQIVELIESKPTESKLLPMLEMLDIKTKLPPFDFIALFDPLIAMSDVFVAPVLKIYLNQSHSTDLADHLIRLLVLNMNREVYQKFMLVNMRSVIACCIESTRLSDQANKLIDFIFARFPTKALKFDLLTQFPASTICRLLRVTIYKLAIPARAKRVFHWKETDQAQERRFSVALGVWREIIKTMCHLNDDEEQLVMADVDAEKRALIIIGKLENLGPFTYAMCSRQLLPEIKFLIKSGSEELWKLVCRQFKKPLIQAIRQHLLLEVVKLLEEEDLVRMQTIIDWLSTTGDGSDSSFNELLTGRILDCGLKYSKQAKSDWTWKGWTKPLLRKAHQNGRLQLGRLELIAIEHCWYEDK